MGQQQLLLIVLGLIIIAIAIVLGITLFRANAIESKRNNVINECINLSSMAHSHYRKPSSLGGGNRAFDNSKGGTKWVIPVTLQVTANGHYQIASQSADQIVINAVGNEVVTGGDSVEVNMTITPNAYSVAVVH